VSPYGESKLMIERALRWYAAAHRVTWAALRYFNAAGADPEGKIGEMHLPETHLIPLILEATLGGKALDVYGDDYPTPDGTCVRDYIHVSDLADAHVRSLDYLINGGEPVALNLGTGAGHSVREVIDTVQAVTGRKVTHNVTPRRPGDPAVLIADSNRATKVLGWRPQFSALKTIVSSAWNWHSKCAKELSA